MCGWGGGGRAWRLTPLFQSIRPPGVREPTIYIFLRTFLSPPLLCLTFPLRRGGGGTIRAAAKAGQVSINGGAGFNCCAFRCAGAIPTTRTFPWPDSIRMTSRQRSREAVARPRERDSSVSSGSRFESRRYSYRTHRKILILHIKMHFPFFPVITNYLNSFMI